MKHDNLYLHQVFINALVTQILSPASPSMRFLHRAVAIKQCRTQHSEPILHNEAHRPHESTRQRACAAQLECLCKFVYTWLPQDTYIQISLYRWMLRVWCDLTRVFKTVKTMAGPRLVCFTHPCDTDSL